MMLTHFISHIFLTS